MISEQAYIWIYLPGESKPVPCGVVAWSDEEQTWGFRYGRSYQGRENAIALEPPGLPLSLIDDEIKWLDRDMNGALRDASPDAWGRQVMMKKRMGERGNPEDLDEVDFLLGGNIDRIGALDATDRPDEYNPNRSNAAPLEQLLTASERLQQGLPLDAELDQALNHGTSVGGARPKALLHNDEGYWIAKFSASNDYYHVVGIESASMRLAEEVGLDVAPSQLETSLNKDVLLVKRFDRAVRREDVLRRHMLSAMTLLGLDEYAVRQGHSSYLALADMLLKYGAAPNEDRKELFARMVFNILMGNTDDHARNHACFWDGHGLRLTPAYDLCPQPRGSYGADQAMQVGTQGRRSTLNNVLSACATFGLTVEEAQSVIDRQRRVIEARWRTVMAEARVPKEEIEFLGMATILSPSIDDE